jgi:demethylmenaquinone methyltransferase/2-methoxy-6-polyprenyl-1,4-benzoquinol methylase
VSARSAGELHPAVAASGAPRAAEVRRLFAGIAHRYALANHVLSAYLDVSWRRAAARALAVGPGSWCLDACCGTGDLGLAVARGGCRVIGVDFCRPMLAAGRPAAPASAGMALVEADALRLPLRDRAVDAACMGFGLRNLVDPAAGLREMARVVRPGGRVAVLEFSEPSGRLSRPVFRAYVRHVLPRLGDAVTGSTGTYRYLPQTIGQWFDPAELAALMRACGLADVSCRRLALGAVALHVGTVGARAAAGPGDCGEVRPSC